MGDAINIATHRIRASMLKEDIHFAARIGFKIIILAQKALDHLWAFCRNFNDKTQNIFSTIRFRDRCVIRYNIYLTILAVEFEDTIFRYISKISLYFKKFTQGPCALFDKPIKPFVRSVTQLVRLFRDPKMANLLTGPRTK